MISVQEMSAVLDLAQRALKSQAEALWLEQLVNKIQAQITAQQLLDEKKGKEASDE